MNDDKTIDHPENERPTREVGSEGGSDGDLELERDDLGTGSEAGETWRPTERDERPVAHDETGEGRRSP